MELDIRDMVRIARRRGWVVLVATLIGGLAMLLAGLVQDDQYVADARLLVLPAEGARDSFNALRTSQSMAETYRQIMESEPMFARVIDTLELDTTPQDLDKVVTSAVLPGALLIEVAVEDEDPELAARVATTFVEEFTAYLGELPQINGDGGGLAANVVVSDPATVPDEPVGPRVVFLVVLGLFGGFLVGLGIVVVQELAAALRRSESEPRPETTPDLHDRPAIAGTRE